MPTIGRVASVAAFVALFVGASVAHGRQESTPTSFSVLVLAESDPRVPLGNARVTYTLEGPGKIGGAVRTGRDGRALVSDLAEGVYTLEVATPGYVTRTGASVVVVEHATHHVDIVLQPEPSSTTHVRFGALLFGGVILVGTMVRGRTRSLRMRNE